MEREVNTYILNYTGKYEGTSAQVCEVLGSLKTLASQLGMKVLIAADSANIFTSWYGSQTFYPDMNPDRLETFRDDPTAEIVPFEKANELLERLRNLQ